MPLIETTTTLPPSSEVGTLGVYQLKRLWARSQRAKASGGRRQPMDLKDIHRDHVTLDAIGLGLEQTQRHLSKTNLSFEEFEAWVVETTGGVAPEQVARLNAALSGAEMPAATRARLAEIDAMPPVLSAEDLAHWEEHGYVIVHDAVPEEGRSAAEEAIWKRVGARPDVPDSWYTPRDHGIMVQFFQHPAFTANRNSPRIHKAFAQLWGSADLWVTTDRAGFNVPERPGWMFPGPHMHWDVSLAQPIPFGTQGILYLTDTPGEQGAFTCVPGFQRRIDAWLDSLPPGTDPRTQDLDALGSKPIAGRAGDLVIWDHKLPHGSRPNRGVNPRIVQYINMTPLDIEQRDAWR